MDDSGSLRAGQLRELRPHPLDRTGEPRLVVITKDAWDSVMPDDIGSFPGPCRMVQAILVFDDPQYATSVDLCIPASATSLGVELYAMLTSTSAIRLAPGTGPDRLGPVLGTLPDAAVDLSHAVTFGSVTDMQEAAEALDATGDDWRVGDAPVNDPDHPAWAFHAREIENYNRLAAW